MAGAAGMSKSYAKSKGRAGKSPPFVMLPKSMMQSEAFRKLSPHATRLLLVVAFEFRGANNGSLVVLWETAQQFGFSNKRTFYRALGELEQKGFIEMTKPPVRRGKPSATRWALTWMPINEPVGDVRHDVAASAKASNLWKEWTDPEVRISHPKNQNPRCGSATDGGTNQPPKNGEDADPRCESATYKPVIHRNRGANLPPVFRSKPEIGGEP